MPAARVLVVDDNSMMRRAVCDVLGAQPEFNVIGEAGDGQKAIERAEELRPNLVVMDYLMPLMTGIEAARTLKHTMPDVRVILLTAYGDDPKLVECAQGAGIDAVVSKDEGIARLMLIARQLVRA
jgi:two-component system, NarL family, response regulator LiaR